MADRKHQFEQREQEIIKVAKQLLLEMGDDKVTVELIAERVGIGKGTIYKHFRSKVELYGLLMIDYEKRLAEQLKQGIVDVLDSGKQGSAFGAYYDFRLQHAAEDLLFQHLEDKLSAAGEGAEQIAALHEVRLSNLDSLAKVVEQRIQQGGLQDVPAYYHICAVWALVQGAVALQNAGFFRDIVQDPQGVTEFIRQLGVRMIAPNAVVPA